MLNISLFVLRFDVNPVSPFLSHDPMNSNERQLMMDTFSLLIDVFDSANVTYFMYGGTLIGSLRHHGIIPWDDDIDIIIAAENRSAVRSILYKLYPKFELYTPRDDQKSMLQWKFYSSSGSNTAWPPKNYRYPYVDIFFFEQNATHIWDLEPEYHASGFVWPKSSVFPLVRRPFGSLSVPAPCDAFGFVSTNYAGAAEMACASPGYNHRTDRHVSFGSQVLPCSHLWHVFPFVFRTKSADGEIVETLKIGNWTLQSHMVPADVCSGS